MKGWLHEVPLMQPGIAAVRDEPLAEQRFKDLIGIDVFAIVSLILLENMLDTIRVVDQVSGPGEKAHANNITILAGHGQCKT